MGIIPFEVNYILSTPFLTIGTDYPVNADSLSNKLPLNNIPSKGSLILSLRNTISPGTRCLLDILVIF